MPPTLSYPGVYIQELPSGVRTIVGVATSITAFVGRALRGPTDADADSPVVINSFADFERTFGGLWTESQMGYAVYDFYQNGGGQAIIVRLFNPDSGAGAKAAKACMAVGSITLEAASPGAWGNLIEAAVDHSVGGDVAQEWGLSDGDLFNLTVQDAGTGKIEQFRNVTVKESPRRLDRVLKQDSSLVRVQGALPDQIPAPGSYTVLPAAEASNGQSLEVGDFTASRADKTGLYALEKADLFNLLCIPPFAENDDTAAEDTSYKAVISAAASYCEERRAMLIVDPLAAWTSKAAVTGDSAGISTLGTSSKNAAVFFPRLRKPDPLRKGQIEEFAPCGAVAGVFARTDATRGVWKAPAGLDATLVGVLDLSVPLTDMENGELNPLAVNCLRATSTGDRVVWGARTLQGDDRRASEWKYIPVRRLALYIEESLYRGTQWVVFEPNDEPLWAQIRLNVGAFMHNLFRQGAFQGQSPRDAYLVKCDKETTTQNDIDLGIVNIVVGFAPLKPAEFVVIKIQQMAGQVQV